MADNIDVTPGSGRTVAADEVGGALYQRVKISVGADGSAGDMTAGAGSVGATTPRTTLANDDPAVTALQLIDDAVLADDAAFTPGTTKVVMAGFEYDDTAPDSVNEGDGGAARMSANRNVYTQIRDAAGNERGVNVASDGSIGTRTAHATTKSLTNASVSISSSGENTVVSGTASQTIRVFRLHLTAAAAVTMTIKDAAGGNTLAVIPLQPNGVFAFDAPSGEPMFVTATAGAFIISLSSAVSVTGFVQYTKSA